MTTLKDLLRALSSQEHALTNARRASTRLSREAVQRYEVEIFLAERLDRQSAHEAGPSGSERPPAPHYPWARER